MMWNYKAIFDLELCGASIQEGYLHSLFLSILSHRYRKQLKSHKQNSYGAIEKFLGIKKNFGPQCQQPVTVNLKSFKSFFFRAKFQVSCLLRVYNIFPRRGISVYILFIFSSFNPLSANPTKWSNTLKNFVGC